jgi:signal recognition particle receptor subunit beta
MQYNKRDLPSAVSVEELREVLNKRGVPEFEAVASKGVGVFETLKAIARLVFMELKKSGA